MKKFGEKYVLFELPQNRSSKGENHSFYQSHAWAPLKSVWKIGENPDRVIVILY